MTIGVIFIISFCVYFLTKKIKSITNLEIQIIYILMGILVGLVLRDMGLGNIKNVLPGIEKYNSMALLVLFFSAGFSINVAKLKESGKVAVKMFTLPSYGELVVDFIVIYTLVRLIPDSGFALSAAEVLIVAGIFVTSSPANVVPICVDMIKDKATGKNNIPSTMIVSTVIDGFITTPLIFAGIFVFLTSKSEMVIDTFDIVKLFAMTLIGLALSLVVGMGIGRVEVFIIRRIFKKKGHRIKSSVFEYLFTIIVFFVGISLIMLISRIGNLREIMTLFGILVVLGIGLGINIWDKTGMKNIIGSRGNQIFSILGMPIIFIYVGANIELKVLLVPKLLIMFLIITLIGVVFKETIARHVLKEPRYTPEERTFAANCFIPKGVGLSNFTVLFGVILGTGEDVIRFMAMLSAVSIITTMTIGIKKLNKEKGSLITEEYNGEK